MNLHEAAMTGDMDAVNSSLAKSADVNRRDDDSNTPLHWAARRGHTAVVQVLLEKGAEVNVENNGKNTPLHWAAREGHTAVVQLLLEKGAEVNVANNGKNTPLHWGTYNRYTAVVQVLLEKGADVNVANNGNNTPLHWAARWGHTAIVQLLLEKGAKVNVSNNGKNTPLHWGTYNGHIAVVQLLLEKGADVHALGENKSTALHWAAGQGYRDVLQLLLDKSAEINAVTSYKNTPLHWASYNGNRDVVQLLLLNGAKVNAVGNGKSSPLHWAARNGHSHVVRALLERGAEVNATNNYKSTPLKWAAEMGRTAVAQLLLGNGAKVNPVDKNKNTPLHEAARNGHTAVVQVLLDNGAKVSALDKGKKTPLREAARNGHTAVVQLLLENGAKVTEVDKKKNTALHWAAGNGHAAVVQVLLEKGAEVNAVNTNKDTSLHWATYSGQTEHRLLEKDAEAEAVTNDMSTPLHHAATDAKRLHVHNNLQYNSMTSDYMETIRLLLDAGADTAVRNKQGKTAVDLVQDQTWKQDVISAFKEKPGYAFMEDDDVKVFQRLVRFGGTDKAKYINDNRLLHRAAGQNAQKVVNLLLHLGAVINQTDAAKKTPLHVAIEHGATQVVDILLKNGADVYAKVGQFTPLHLAVVKKSMTTACKLVEHLHPKDFDPSLHFYETHNSYAALHWAASGNDETMTSVLLKSQRDLEVRDEAGNTPLHIASAYGNLAITKMLIEHGAHAGATNKDKNTALHLAAARSNADVVRCLMENGLEYSAAKNNASKIPLQLAVYHDCLDACRVLVGLPDQWEMKGMKSFKALHWAVAGDDAHTMKGLLATSNGETEMDDKDALGRTPMYIALDCNNIKAMACLIECRPITKDETDEHGDPILFTAYMHGSKDIFEYLIHRQANIRNVNGDTILHLVVRHNDLNATHYLQNIWGNKFPKLVREANCVGDTALHLAVSEDNSDIVRILLDNGGEAQISNNSRTTPIDIAKEKPQILYMLDESIEHVIDVANVTGIHKLIADGNIDGVREVIEPGDVNHQTNSGMTPLLIASEKGSLEMTKLLVEYEADINKVDNLKRSPIHFAARQKSAAMLAYLLTEKAVEANPQDFMGRTPLHWAGQVGNADNVDRLLRLGEDVSPFTKDNQNNTPLDLLIAFATSLNQHEKDTMNHLLQAASARGQTQDVLSMVSSAVTVLLLKAPQEMVYPTMSFILTSIEPGFKEILRFPVYLSNQLACYSKEVCVRWSTHTLLSALTKVLDTGELRNLLNKIDHYILIKSTNFLRQNAIHLLSGSALTSGEEIDAICEKIDILSDAKVDIDEADVNDRTPLHLACRHGNITIAHKLLTLTKEGSRAVLGQDVQGRTSIDYLMRHYTSDVDHEDMHKCIALLIEKGAISRRVVFRPLEQHTRTPIEQHSINTQTVSDTTHPTGIREQFIDEWICDNRRDQPEHERKIKHYLEFNAKTDSTVLNSLIMKRIQALVHQLCQMALMQMESTLEFKDVILSGSMCEGTKVGGVDEMDFLLRMEDAEENMVVDRIENNFVKLRRPNLVGNEVSAAGLALMILYNVVYSVRYVSVLRHSGMSIEDIRRNKLKVFTLILTATDINGDDKEITVDVVPTIFKELVYENNGPYIGVGRKETSVVRNLKSFPLLMKDQGFEISFSELEHETMKRISRTAIQAYRLLKLMRSAEICPRLSSMKPHVGIEDVVTSYTFKQALLWVVDPYGRRDKCEELKEIDVQLPPDDEQENQRVRLFAVQVLGVLLTRGMDAVPLYFCPSDKLRLTHNCKLICRIIKGLLE